MGEVGQPYTKRLIGRDYAPSGPRIARHKYAVEEMVFDWSCDLGEIAKLCRNPEAIAKACGFAKASNEKDCKKAERAVYVIGVDGLPVSKIGVSNCPMSRRLELQGAHWADLVLHAILWFPTRKSDTIEQSALRAAEEMGCRLNGEWVAMEPEEAFETVLKAARYHDAPACDSATWLQNWNRRVEGLREAKQEQQDLDRHIWQGRKAA